MGFFSNLSANQKIIRKINELEGDVESLKKASRRVEGLDLEFTALWGKVNRALGRIEKRAATMEAAQTPEEAEAETPDDPASNGLSLTPDQLKWQKRIMKERGRSA